ncbi:MAG: hypothetical protein N3D12_05300 [Candidatus Methanomethyliaceae archaeon]|nr:hypothetical protein [Candidatus Methanomethyliaceae archaeon]
MLFCQFQVSGENLPVSGGVRYAFGTSVVAVLEVYFIYVDNSPKKLRRFERVVTVGVEEYRHVLLFVEEDSQPEWYMWDRVSANPVLIPAAPPPSVVYQEGQLLL